ncbi:MAG: D-3-phosphoglycerate dehydrogenase [Cyclobacteriaceae bacterium]|nr:MAG: D-3-phosphoglycerate dehydrogenase [Cyclobacteriaceae bacterium]
MSFKVQVFNKIDNAGLQRISDQGYKHGADFEQPDAILLRSYSLHEYQFAPGLLAVARAGAGVNNIPIEACTKRGIVVFNTPGANANAVKELVITGLMLSSRKIYQGITWANSLDGSGSEIPKLIEKGKSNFAGPEIQGKTLGVIGLGAIGMLVANAAENLGMKVVGYDPYISVDAAWQLSKYVKKAPSLESLLRHSDYISLHMPLMDSTKNFIDKSKIALMKNGVRILNFARAGLVNNSDIMEAVQQQKVACFVTDFPDEHLISHPNIISYPHLGASTPESEKNCAVMAVEELIDYLENGNIKNSVNFPLAELPRTDGPRLIVINENIPAMVGQITNVLADQQINISDMLNQHRGNIAYTIIDLDDKIQSTQLKKLQEIAGVMRVRYLD